MPDALPDLPPLPEPDGVVAYEARPYEPEWISSEGAYTAEQMCSYAREAVRAALAEMDADADRYRWLVDWMIRRSQLSFLSCQPKAHMPAGCFWVLRGAAILGGDSCHGYGKTADEAIDDAIAAEKEKSHE